jgi:DNA-binding SARP family transcriptional activator/streptogramin lyase
MAAKGQVAMEYGLLGPLEVRNGDGPIALGAAKQRAVLALLLLNANRVVARERMIDGLWGDDPPETAVASVQVYVSRLRKLLSPRTIVTRAPGYLLEAEPEAIDLTRFERLVAGAREAAPEPAATQLREALALWRGPPLAEFVDEPFLRTEAKRLEELRLSVLEERIDADLALGRHAGLVGELEMLIAEHPYRERLRGALMLALYRSGRQAEALDAYRDARAALGELGLEPGAELKLLERQILTHAPALDLPPSPGADGPAEQPRTAGARRRRIRIVAAFAVGIALAAAAAVELATHVVAADPAPTLLRIDPHTDRIVARVHDRWSGAPFGPNLWAVAGTLWQQAGGDGRTVAIRSLGTGRLLRTVALPRAVFPYANGFAIGFGALWALESGIVISAAPPLATIERLDELSGRVVARIAIPGDTRNHVIAAGDGAVWVLDQNGTLFRIDPATNRVTRRVATGSLETWLAVPAGGYVWIPETVNHALLRYDERTGAAKTFRYAALRWPLADIDRRLPSTLIVGFEARTRTLWVLNGPGATLLPIGVETGFKGTDPVGLDGAPSQAVLARGSIWVAAGSVVDRLVLATGDRETISLPKGMNATGIAVDPSTGAVWVGNGLAIPSSPNG